MDNFHQGRHHNQEDYQQMLCLQVHLCQVRAVKEVFIILFPDRIVKEVKEVKEFIIINLCLDRIVKEVKQAIIIIIYQDKAHKEAKEVFIILFLGKIVKEVREAIIIIYLDRTVKEFFITRDNIDLINKD
ncbi:MAG: hypothetical protein EZS28_039038 [Streblomastix strix]|uniref:Uncharacterized protein n=1 Tax=Streblomastix strix TaxID=222440 RepID=A0A5J4U561_9EUKA|nr:MAG: hypothetical protein EZS28_039038 [Streblomastix strix]